MATITQSQTSTQITGINYETWLEIFSQNPVEVVDGELVDMSPPEISHVIISRRLFISLYRFVEEKQLGEVWPDSTAYLLEEDEKSGWVKGSRVPDVSFVAAEHMQAHFDKHGTDGPLRLAPDLAVEVVSTNDRYSDLNKKIADYLRYGVKLVWIIDPQQRTVRICTPDNMSGVILQEEDTLKGEPVLEGWSMTVKHILDGQPVEEE